MLVVRESLRGSPALKSFAGSLQFLQTSSLTPVLGPFQMSRIHRDLIRRQLEEAEGYLMLDLPRHALEILERYPNWPAMQFEANLLQGEALRSLERYREALAPLETAAMLRPGDVRVALALGWCYKRTNRLAQAIDVLEHARRKSPDNPLLRYNLACYWSLVGDLSKALSELEAALRLDPELRGLIADEPDFEALRSHPEFEKVAGVQSP